jgi:hypothetical protein
MEQNMEIRIYSIMREDIPMSRIEALTLHASGYVSLFKAINESRAIDGRDMAYGYHPQIQPKLALRAKGEKDFRAAECSLTEAGIPYVVTKNEEGVPVCLHIVPSKRDDLPKEVSRLQLFSHLKHEQPSLPFIHHVSTGMSGTPIAVAVVDFENVPLGKMLVQAGHAAWTAASLMTSVSALDVALLPQETVYRFISEVEEARSGGPIVDAGRTIFERPTTTAGWSKLPYPDYVHDSEYRDVIIEVLEKGFPDTKPLVQVQKTPSGVIVELSEDYVETFLETWPAHGIYVEKMSFEFDENGNLIDMSSNQDGPVVLALSHEAQVLAIANGALPQQLTMTREDIQDAADNILKFRAELVSAEIREGLEKEKATGFSRTIP